MVDIYLVVDLIVVVALFMLGLTVWLQNKQIELNRNFAFFVCCIAIWIVANYISNDISFSAKVALIASYLIFGFSYATAVYLLKFSFILSGNKKVRLIYSKLRYILYVMGILFFTPLVVRGVKVQGTLYAVKFGPLVALYGVGVIGVILSAMYLLHQGIKFASGEREGQLKVLYRSLYISLPLLITAQFIIPAFTGWFGLTNIGILPMLIVVAGLYYGVIKHHLFELRWIAARSTAYILSLMSLLFIFTILTLFAGRLLDNSSNINALRVIYTLFAVTLAYAFPLLKRFFDSVTRRIFYRDVYDTQVFLDEFNKIIVSTFELNKLLNKILALVEDNLKPTYCLFGLKEDDYMPRKIIGTGSMPQFSDLDISYVRNQTPRMHKKIIITDFLEEQHRGLQNALQKLNVSIIARMTTSVDAEGIGYLVLGPKKSGSMYTSQDVKVLEIISNELVVAVQNALHTEEIERFNATLQSKIKEATRRLRKTNEKLKALDEAKDDFVSMASHQLRTPLTSVKGNISLVLDGDAGKISDLQRQLLEQAFTSSQRMVFLIADLLNVSRLKTGKFVIERAPVNLADIIEEEVRQLIDTAKSRHLTLSYVKPEGITDLMLDDTKTRQVIMNFVDNAIYYTPAGGKIDVVLSETESSVECRVIDNGIGVPLSERPHLFSKFYRAANARKARPDGTGLGLFMAKKVIVSEGGALIFESEEGKGSTFGFSFPKAKLAVNNYVPEDTDANLVAAAS